MFDFLSDIIVASLLAAMCGLGVTLIAFPFFEKRSSDGVGAALGSLAIGALVFIAVMFGSVWSAWGNEYPIEVERFVDSDTFDGRALTTFPVRQFTDIRVRLYCINSPESDTPEGREMNAIVESLGITSGTLDPVKKDVFGRWLAFFRPAGWDISLNEWLYRQGVPLYARLTRAERAECERRLGVEP